MSKVSPEREVIRRRLISNAIAGKAERRYKARKQMIREAQEFLIWLRQKPRAFVVFNKADLIALRK